MPINTYDVIVVGGGASGITAAATAAKRGARTLLLEAQPRMGRKLLSTGNGRCNITNSDITPDHYHSAALPMVERVLNTIPKKEIEKYFERIGVSMFEERDGRKYPLSETATGVLDMLRFELSRAGVETVCDSRVTSLHQAARRSGKCWTVRTDRHEYFAKAVILACGSMAAPQLGGCDDGIRLAKTLGVKYIKPTPALSPLLCSSPLLPSLKGVRVHCSVSLEIDGKLMKTEDGELQFNENNLSGICIFQLSSVLARLADKDSARVVVRLLPDKPKHELLTMLMSRSRRLGNVALEDFLSGMLNKRVTVALLKSAKLSPMNRPAASLSKEEIVRLCEVMCRWEFPVSGSSGYKQAQVMSGGIAPDELLPTLEVKRHKGLYVCGELVDCDGDCGGYNLHWAWCSGMLAGRSAAISCKEGDRSNESTGQY